MGIPYAEVIGDPVVHSKSPLIHKFWLERLGLEGDYRAIRISREQLPTYLEIRRTDRDWRGCNVTMPLKEQAWHLVDRLDPATRRIGALNTVIHDIETGDRLAGANTDWVGLNLALNAKELAPARAAIIGTGGAARAAMEELRGAGVRHVTLVSRSEYRASRLLADFGMTGNVLPLGSAPEGDLLINASPCGMHGQPDLDIDLSNLARDATVLDMVYAPASTPLLRAAHARGLRTIDGLTMLIHQASVAFTYFFKGSPQRAHVAELRDLLAR